MKMSNDRLDLVIFGATGFTGKYAVKNMFNLNKKYPDIKWAIAGRSKTKLDTLMQEMADAGENTAAIKIILADVNNAESLNAMCSQTKVLVNCCGPYRLYGEQVVKAAVENKCHHVDVSGEPQFIEKTELKYNENAAQAGVYIISACGFDCVPNDLGVLFLQENFDGVLNSVESYLSSVMAPESEGEVKKTGLVHYGTWESIIHCLANYNEINKINKQLYPKPMPSFTPKITERYVIHRRDSHWCVPFPSSDQSVVERSQRFMHTRLHQRPVQFRPYFKTNGFLIAVASVFAGLLLFVLSNISFTRKLLLKHPKLFTFGVVSHEGPSEKVTEACTCKFIMIGQGWEQGADVDNSMPNKEVVAKVTCKNPGYGMTTIALLLCAITILKEEDKMPGTGGVLTTAAAFAKTDLLKSLIENDVKFEIVKKGTSDQSVEDKIKSE